MADAQRRPISSDGPTPELASGFQLFEVDPAFRADPHARLTPLREQCPVRRDPAFADTITIAAHETARAVLNDGSLLRDLNEANPASLVRNALQALFAEVSTHTSQPARTDGSPALSFFFADDPHHARLRGIVGPPFIKRVAAFRPQIERVVNEELAKLDGRATFDLVDDYAIPIPVRVIAEVIGVADEDLPRFRDWSDGSFLMFNPMRTPAEHERCIASLAGLFNFFAELVEARKTDPRDDLVTDLVKLQAEGAEISDAEITVQLNMLLTAGNVTTTDLIANAAYKFLTHPEALVKLLAEPKLIGSAVEEALRMEPPASRTFRLAAQEGEIAGCPMHKGDMMSVLILAANFDPAVFENPHEFDIARAPNPHLTFGGGKRICLGAPLARLEAQLAILKLFQKLPNLRRANDTPLEWRATPGQRGPAHLMVAAR